MRTRTSRYYKVLSLLLGIWGLSLVTGTMLFGMHSAMIVALCAGSALIAAQIAQAPSVTLV